MGILVVTVCNQYWKRLKLSLESIERARSFSTQLVETVVVTSEEDHPMMKNISLVEVDPSWSLRKSSQLQVGLERGLQKISDCDMVLFTDADILHPPDLFMTLESEVSCSTFFGAERAHLDGTGTLGLLKKPLPEEEYLKRYLETHRQDVDPARKSPYMGWFQAFSLDLVEALPFNEYQDHLGYDRFDFECSQALKRKAQRVELLSFSRPHIHLDHGNWGKNWKGTNSQL